MKTKAAVLQVLNDNSISRYRLAKNLKVQPIMISNYINKGTRMGVVTATQFEAVYGITISDVYDTRCDNDTKTVSEPAK